ncbi:hypothetical protein [Mucilaginibacter endophyticus]|uniref:hypothetical protein n=1 Tax=Mucilaginibacter endophyticus TaxID=2675003 RepID=UPI000E0DAFFA|nr:hypothetical protein [Mucilaginibacter endophyticus]
MLQLISKLQHNTYEKGEYSDEQARNIEETINLIKDFPWDTERALTDIQLTGPSVTIQDSDLNYLKLGLYFNGKFCLYYLDSQNHLYEYHASTIDEAYNLVRDFFEQKLDIKQFDKHLFNIGNKPHFITNDFVYRVKPSKIVLTVALISSFVVSSIYFRAIAGQSSTPHPAGVIFLFAAIIGVFIGGLVFIFTPGKKQYLQISRGNNLFSYGYDEKHIILYDKLNIQEISYYVSNKGWVSDLKITFKNGSYIQPENLINAQTLLRKFPKALNITIKQVNQTLSGRTE